MPPSETNKLHANNQEKKPDLDEAARNNFNEIQRRIAPYVRKPAKESKKAAPKWRSSDDDITRVNLRTNKQNEN